MQKGGKDNPVSGHHESVRSILVIRFYAVGDLLITFPYLAGLKTALGDVEIDILTVDENSGLCESIDLFSKVIPLNYQRRTSKLVLSAGLKLRFLNSRNYDVVIDLQNNWVSRIIRKYLHPVKWSAFDRYSPISASERTLNTIQQLDLGEINPVFKYNFNDAHLGKQLLKEHGLKDGNELVVLNPAGFYETRNWPIDNYVMFGKLWLERFANTQFLLLGIDRMEQKAVEIENGLKGEVINLVGKTSLVEAFSIIQCVDFVLSEDSGLMHMAWVSGKPTLALFGSSRSDWSRPLGEQSYCLNSSDLECGECMEVTCLFGDVRCLTRYTPEFVFKEATNLLSKETL